MKAAVVHQDTKSIEIKEVPEPAVRPGTILLKTVYCSICGSDIEYLDGALDGLTSFEEISGAILGHEWVADIAAVGDGVSGWSVGDRVTYCWTKLPCGVCYFCRRFLFHLCIGGASRGSVFSGQSFGARGGAMAEYFIKPPQMVAPIPQNVSPEEACLAEPLATSVGSVKAADLGPGKSAVIFGAGKIGLGTMLCARASGAAPIIVIDVVKSRLDKAREMGADVVLNAREVDVIAEVIKLTDAGPDAVLICVREGAVLNQAAEMVRLGGTIALTGFVNPMTVDPRLWVEKQLTLKGHISGPVRTALDLMAHRQVDVRPLISEIIPLEDAQRGFDSIRSGQNIAVLLKP